MTTEMNTNKVILKTLSVICNIKGPPQISPWAQRVCEWAVGDGGGGGELKSIRMVPRVCLSKVHLDLPSFPPHVACSRDAGLPSIVLPQCLCIALPSAGNALPQVST